MRSTTPGRTSFQAPTEALTTPDDDEDDDIPFCHSATASTAFLTYELDATPAREDTTLASVYPTMHVSDFLGSDTPSQEYFHDSYDGLDKML